MPVAQRIPSLKAVSETIAEDGALSFALRDFLDGFYEQPCERAFADEPPRLDGLVKDGARQDAYLAAVAEHLCRINDWRIPAWTRKSWRYLALPWFGMNSHAGRMLLIMDSPSAFRARNIFVSADALSRV